MSSNKNIRKKGFTLIELTLALAFISVMLIMVAVLIMQMTTIYQKTLTIKSVNATGREIIDDISRRISESTLISTRYYCSQTVDEGHQKECMDDNAYKYIYHQNSSKNFRVRGKEPEQALPTNGTFCTGLYSYIWNTGYVLNPENEYSDNYRAKIKYNNGEGTVESDTFRLVRVFDSAGSVCKANLNAATYAFDETINNPTYNLPEEPVELITNSESDLAIYDMMVFHPARHAYSGQAFYSGFFILATLQGEVDINASSDYCKSPPSNLITEFTYCAINKFNFASQATGEEITDGK